MLVRIRILITALMLAALAGLAPAGAALAISAAAFTTIDTTVDGNVGQCLNGNPGVNCNIYTGKQFVWINGGPSGAALADGSYFFAVLDPGGQANPNDGTPKNLSSPNDAWTNREFTVSGGVVSYSGTHDFDSSSSNGLIRLMPYNDTSNPGGVYIVAICAVPGTIAPTNPPGVAAKSCKYDAFKVSNTAQVSALLSGEKYLDANADGQLDGSEPGLQGWTICISTTPIAAGPLTACPAGSTSTTTAADGSWSLTVNPPSGTGTTTYYVAEVIPSGSNWVETGNTVGQFTVTGGATASLSNFVYTVVVPNDHVSAVINVQGLFFGNTEHVAPSCALTGIVTGPPKQALVTVQDLDSGLGTVVVTESNNATNSIQPFTPGTTSPVVVTFTKINQAQSAQFGVQVTDLAGNTTTCDPADVNINRQTGQPVSSTVTGIMGYESTVLIKNEATGISGLAVIVNGVTYGVTGLKNSGTATLNIAAALQPGGNNTVTLIPNGKPGSAADVVIGGSTPGAN